MHHDAQQETGLKVDKNNTANKQTDVLLQNGFYHSEVCIH